MSEPQEPSGEAVEPPRRVVIPQPTGDPYLSELERQIIALLVDHVRVKSQHSLLVALGLAHARRIYIKRGGWTEQEKTEFLDGPTYIANLTARINNLHPRQQAKLRHPQRDRKAQQRILEGENQ